MQFGELCGHVAPSLFIACLRDLCTCMWSVTFTYHQILKWHETLHQQQSVVVVNQEITEDQEQLWQKLQHGSVRLVRSFALFVLRIPEHALNPNGKRFDNLKDNFYDIFFSF